MKKNIYKILTLFIILFIIFSQNIIFASMADLTDEQSDKKLEQEQKEWKQEQEQKIGKSSNNYLKELSVNGFNILPSFDKQIINYEITEETSNDSIEIKAEADDEKAKVSGNGKITLNSGENNIKIDVEAENGTVRSYFIKVKKTIKKDIKLNTLKISLNEDNQEVYITPEFNKDIFEYNCEVNSYVEKVNIDANSDIENANIKIEGNENLKEGQNEVIVTLSTDNEEKVVYKINITKKRAEQKVEESKDSKFSFNNIYIPIIIVIVIILLVSLLKMRKGKHNK